MNRRKDERWKMNEWIAGEASDPHRPWKRKQFPEADQHVWKHHKLIHKTQILNKWMNEWSVGMNTWLNVLGGFAEAYTEYIPWLNKKKI